jgi:hypothetical protein
MEDSATLTLHVSAGNHVVLTLGDEIQGCVQGEELTLYSLSSIINTDVYFDPGYAPGALFRDVKNLDTDVYLHIQKYNDSVTVQKIVRLPDGRYVVRGKYVTLNTVDAIVFRKNES